MWQSCLLFPWFGPSTHEAGRPLGEVGPSFGSAGRLGLSTDTVTMSIAERAIVGMALILILVILGIMAVQLSDINATLHRAFKAQTAYPCATGTSVNGFPCINGSAGP